MLASAPVSVARYWMYCPLGLWIAPPAPTAWKSDQLASGVGVLPVRVSNVVPLLVLVRLPHTVCASPATSTREVKVPESGQRPCRASRR